MTRRPAHLAPVGLVVVTAVTAWVALLAWRPFAAASVEFLQPVLYGVVATTVIGVITRRLRMPIIFVLSSQLLGILVYLNLLWGSSLLPGPDSIRTTTQAFADSVDVLQFYASPIPADLTNSMPILVMGGLLCHLLVDLFALTLRRAALAGLPLLVIHSLPISVLDRSVNWFVFVLVAAGYLAMLALEEGSWVSRWGRDFGVSADRQLRGVLGEHDPQRHPLAVGATATALALFVPTLLPTMGLQLFGGVDGPGGSSDEVRITNPMTDLKRDLVRDRDIPLLRVRTDGAAPEYLRTAVLTTFTGDTWTPGDRSLPSSNGADGALPPPIGLSPTVPTSTQDWTIAAEESFVSTWLPAPANLESIRAGRGWRYDADVLDFHAANSNTTTAGMTWSATELIPQITGADLAAAEAAPARIANRYASLPGSLPRMVSDAAAEVTAGLSTDFEKAQALQNWFRDTGEFTYSLEPSAGNGNDALVEFLEERIGYCEQFASAMAVMAREVGIPARVAVGFFQSTEISSGLYEFSSHDLHAWPELYFEDYGWVRFEPTPASHIGQVPSYAQDPLDGIDLNDLPTAGPGDEIPTEAPEEVEPTQAPEVVEQEEAAGESDSSLGRLLWIVPVVLLLVMLLLAPRLLRRQRSSRRWHGSLTPAEAAWAELRDTCLDLGRPWPSGRSPRATGDAVAEWFGPAEPDPSLRIPRAGAQVNPEAVQALDVLVGAVEEQRYAAVPPPNDDAALREALDSCIAALENGVTRERRLRASWTPRSLLRRKEPSTEEIEELVGDHVH